MAIILAACSITSLSPFLCPFWVLSPLTRAYCVSPLLQRRLMMAGPKGPQPRHEVKEVILKSYQDLDYEELEELKPMYNVERGNGSAGPSSTAGGSFQLVLLHSFITRHVAIIVARKVI